MNEHPLGSATTQAPDTKSRIASGDSGKEPFRIISEYMEPQRFLS